MKKFKFLTPIQALLGDEIRSYYESKRYKLVEFDIDECPLNDLNPLFKILDTPNIRIDGARLGYFTVIAKDVKF